MSTINHTQQAGTLLSNKRMNKDMNTVILIICIKRKCVGYQGKWNQKKDDNPSMELDLRNIKEYVSVSHVTSKVPYPGLTGVNIHTFTLLRGVLRHRQPRPEPRGFQKSRALAPAQTLDLLISIAPTDPSPTLSIQGPPLTENSDSPIPEL